MKGDLAKNQFGYTKAQWDKMYDGEIPEAAKKLINAHICWNLDGMCQICGCFYVGD